MAIRYKMKQTPRALKEINKEIGGSDQYCQKKKSAMGDRANQSQ